MLFKKELLNNQPIHTYNKKQKNIIATSSLVAGLGLLATVAIGYLFFFLVFKTKIMSHDALVAISTVTLILSLISLIFFSFTRMSVAKYAIIFPIYIFSSGLGFSSLFAIFDIGELLMIFGVAGIAMLISALLGFCLPSKITSSLMGMATITMCMLFIVSITFGLISWYVDVFVIEISKGRTSCPFTISHILFSFSSLPEIYRP